MLKRNEEYNKTIDYCYEMEKEGRLFIITPSPEFSIGRTEHSFEKRANMYHHGYRTIDKEIDKLIKFLA